MNYRLAVIVAVMVVFGLLLMTGGTGGLGHFSPYTLEYTTQSEWTLFRGAVPIFRSFSQSVDNELVTILLEEGFVTPMETGEGRWELIFHWNDAWRGGDGGLYDVFVRHRREIIEWSKADRERARIYWREGFKYLRSQRKVDNSIGRAILTEGWRCESISELREKIEAMKRADSE